MAVHSFSTDSSATTSENLAQTPPTSPSVHDRFTVEYLTLTALTDSTQDGRDVMEGLTQVPKTLPPKYFYDDRGSQLFEAITGLPEYYLTRTERQILQTFASAIVDEVGACDLIELGSGSASKTRLLFEAYQQQGCPLRYVPVDVSGGMLEDSARSLLHDYEGLTIHGLVSTYDAALTHLPATDLPRRMIAFIGSTLGNLSRDRAHQFFQTVSQALAEGDYFLLGIDLHKDAATLEAAYNDAQGVTAEFNLNMLKHLNWRYQGDFNLDQFRHVARYNERDRQIEMYIESLADQRITLADLEFSVTFQAGERLLSEISRKFDLDVLTQELGPYGLNVTDTFTDEHRQFALLLCQKEAL